MEVKDVVRHIRNYTIFMDSSISMLIKQALYSRILFLVIKYRSFPNIDGLLAAHDQLSYKKRILSFICGL